MRARYSWLALALTLVLSGCITARQEPAPKGSAALDAASLGLADALAHYSQALIDETTPGGLDRSLDQWRAAVRADPTNTVLRLRLGGMLLGRKETAEAIHVLEGARRQSPDSVETRLLLGMGYQMAGAWRASAREFDAVTRLAPDRADGYVRLAALLLGQGRHSRAMAVLGAGIRRPGAALPVMQFVENMGRLYVVNGEVHEAISCFRLLLANLPDSVPLREVIGRCYVLADDRPNAIACLEDVLRRDPRNVAVACLLGELHEDAGDLKRAGECFEQATKNGPTDVAPFLRLALIQVRSDPAAALATLQRAVKLSPADPAIHAYIGLIHSHTGDFKAAVDAFAKAESLAAGARNKQVQPQFYFWYGSACERAGRFEQAEALLETCITAKPDSDEALNYLAYMWAERGIKLDKAIEYSKRALAIAPDEGAYLDTLGWIHYKRGDHALALKYLKRALRTAGEDPAVAEHVGDVLKALGRTREARRYWARSLEQAPGNAALITKLKDAGR